MSAPTPSTDTTLNRYLLEDWNMALKMGAQISPEHSIADGVLEVESSGVPIAKVNTINFIGATVTDMGNQVVDVTVGAVTTSTYVREKFTSVGASFVIAGTITFGLEVYKNGVLLTPTDDYAIAGNTVTPVTTAIVTDVFTAIFWDGTGTLTYTREEDTGFTGTTFSLGSATQTNYQLFKNGVLLAATDDYSVAGATVTLVSAAVVTDRFSSIYYV
jgi:hypothetical protein